MFEPRVLFDVAIAVTAKRDTGEDGTQERMYMQSTYFELDNDSVEA